MANIFTICWKRNIDSGDTLFYGLMVLLYFLLAKSVLLLHFVIDIMDIYMNWDNDGHDKDLMVSLQATENF